MDYLLMLHYAKGSRIEALYSIATPLLTVTVTVNASSPVDNAILIRLRYVNQRL
jgi:hypothetical protein